MLHSCSTSSLNASHRFVGDALSFNKLQPILDWHSLACRL
jgi:hypothetical protein